MPCIVYISNYFDHHQSPVANVLYEITDHNFFYIETKPLEDERKQLGWRIKEKPEYVLEMYQQENVAYCEKIILESDVVIWGGCSFHFVKRRVKMGKLTFHASERIFKQGYRGIPYWGRVVKYALMLGRYQNKNHLLLCASAYAASDYNRIGLFCGRSYRWGYFPQTKEYEIASLMKNKARNSILWAARLIELKHPEIPVLVAEQLKKRGCCFELNMIGTGALEAEIQEMIRQKDLVDCVHMLGTMEPERVREQMEKAAVFLFTSDQNEGWGAVVNEAMNSGCVVIANQAIGSVPYLIQNGVNGFVLEKSNDLDEIVRHVTECLEHFQTVQRMGQSAYTTIRNEWNAQIAGERLIAVAAGNPLMDGTGICTKERCEKIHH